MRAPAVRAACSGAALAVGLACACSAGSGEEPAAAASAPATFVQITADGEARTPPQDLEGVTIDIAAGVEYHLEVKSSTAGTSSRLATINGHPLVLAEDVVRIGTSEFGPLQVGDRVALTSEGVFINGERVGELPSRSAASGDSGTND